MVAVVIGMPRYSDKAPEHAAPHGFLARRRWSLDLKRRSPGNGCLQVWPQIGLARLAVITHPVPDARGGLPVRGWKWRCGCPRMSSFPG